MDTLTLEQLLEQITDENMHPEIDTGCAVGNKEWKPAAQPRSVTSGLQRTSAD